MLQQATQPASRRGEDDVVDRAAERALDLLQLVELDGEHREGALRADRVVQAGVGRRDQLVADDQLCECLRAPEGVPGAGGVGSEADGGLGGLQAGLARTHGRVPEPQCGMGEASDAALQGRGLGLRDGLDLGLDPSRTPPFELPLTARSGLSRSVSSRIVARSTDPTPSIMQWWVLVTSAQRPSASSRTTISQSGLVRSSLCE